MFRSKKYLLRGRVDGVHEVPEPLQSASQLRRIMDRERMRSDRSTVPFSLLTLTFATPLEHAEVLAIASACRNRLRLTDDAGILDSGRIGIVLPETAADGAWTVADDILRLLHDLRAPECHVYVYPRNESDWARPKWDDTKVVTAVRPSETVGATNGRQTNGDHSNGSSKRRAAQPSGDHVQSMHSLFLDRLPPWKRAIDLAFSCSALIVIMPLLLLIALMVKLSSRGPVFYSQKRDGYAGRTFYIYKFRTMIVNADGLKSQLQAINEQDGPAFKLKNDPRVTAFGRLLRRTCLDEVPQLLNVIKGDMSLVGPRPMCSKEAKECSQWQRRRLDVTPGLTCIWQVHGGTKATFVEWMRMDLHYARSRSLIKDLHLIALTIPAIIRRDGVY